jgi:peptidoglycan hydrolase-like protein with peptidoglycan-binding domain
VVTNSIGMLKTAKSTAELTAIINGEVVDVKKQAEVTPTPEPAVNYNTLSKGDKSPEVLDMQNRLIELGYLNDTPDGAFGAKTQTAVKIFQQVMGLPVTGIADNATLNAIYADDAPRAGLTNNVMTTPAPTDVPPAAN